MDILIYFFFVETRGLSLEEITFRFEGSEQFEQAMVSVAAEKAGAMDIEEATAGNENVN